MENMYTITVTKARKNLQSLVDKTNRSHVPILIEGRRVGAVLIGKEHWSDIQETLFLNAMPGMHVSIRAGLKTPLTQTSKVLKW